MFVFYNRIPPQPSTFFSPIVRSNAVAFPIPSESNKFIQSDLYRPRGRRLNFSTDCRRTSILSSQQKIQLSCFTFNFEKNRSENICKKKKLEKRKLYRKMIKRVSTVSFRDNPRVPFGR